MWASTSGPAFYHQFVAGVVTRRPTERRSSSRWLGELEAAGWLEWQRSPGHAGINDRFALKTDPESSEPVTPESQPAQPVIVESQPVTPESQPVTLRSQAPLIHPLPER